MRTLNPLRPVARWAVVVLLGALFSGCAAPDHEPAGPPATTSGGFSDTPFERGEYRWHKGRSQTLRDGTFDLLPQEVFDIPSDLGGTIEIGVVRPNAPQGHRSGVIVQASPYWSPLRTIDLRDQYPAWNFVPHGFVFAAIPVRGAGNTGGCMDLNGPADRAILSEAIDWLAEQPWSNGNIGMWGLSSDGSTPWAAAATGNPHLKTIVPMGGINDEYSYVVRNGTPNWIEVGRVPIYYGPYSAGAYLPPDRSPQHWSEAVLCPEAANGMAAAAETFATGARDSIGFWAARDQRPGVEARYRGSVFVIHGLQDWNVDPHNEYPWVNTLPALGIPVKHLLGQWGHHYPDAQGGPRHAFDPRVDTAQSLLNWFEYWLHGNLGADLGPVADVQDSSGQWRFDSAWPPADAVDRVFYLDGDGGLSEETTPAAPTMPVGPAASLPPYGADGTGADNSTLMFWYSSQAALCPECPAFVSAPFDEPLRFAGLPQVHVTVTPSGPATISAWIFRVNDTGWYRLGWGGLDLRYAAGGDEPRTFTPGTPMVARIELEPLDAVIPAGESLALMISEGGYGDGFPVHPSAPLQLSVGGSASLVRLRTFTVEASQFFTPPSPQG